MTFEREPKLSNIKVQQFIKINILGRDLFKGITAWVDTVVQSVKTIEFSFLH